MRRMCTGRVMKGDCWGSGSWVAREGGRVVGSVRKGGKEDEWVELAKEEESTQSTSGRPWN